jgi:hypothetical protein
VELATTCSPSRWSWAPTWRARARRPPRPRCSSSTCSSSTGRCRWRRAAGRRGGVGGAVEGEGHLPRRVPRARRARRPGRRGGAGGAWGRARFPRCRPRARRRAERAGRRHRHRGGAGRRRPRRARGGSADHHGLAALADQGQGIEGELGPRASPSSPCSSSTATSCSPRTKASRWRASALLGPRTKAEALGLGPPRAHRLSTVGHHVLADVHYTLGCTSLARALRCGSWLALPLSSVEQRTPAR